MHHVQQSEEPKSLINYRDKYTKKWIDHYSKKIEEKPKDGFWTKELIRELLIKDFKDNCAYCGTDMGRALSTKGEEIQDEVEELESKAHLSKQEQQTLEDKKGQLSSSKFLLPLGQVDHFKPKNQFPDLVYVWSNYVWSCKDCNKLKGEKFNTAAPPLNPYFPGDTEYLELRESGNYELKGKYKKEPRIKRRFKETRSLINIGNRPEYRASLRSEIEDCLNEIAINQRILVSKLTNSYFGDPEKNIQNCCKKLERSFRKKGFLRTKRFILLQWSRKHPHCKKILKKANLFSISRQD